MFIYIVGCPPVTYSHRSQRTEDPVRSPELKLRTGRLVLRWVTTWEYRLPYVLLFDRPSCEEKSHFRYSVGFLLRRDVKLGLTCHRAAKTGKQRFYQYRPAKASLPSTYTTMASTNVWTSGLPPSDWTSPKRLSGRCQRSQNPRTSKRATSNPKASSRCRK